MNSYVPDYYGFNSFYPDSPYDCYRYVNGVIYEIGLRERLRRGRDPALRRRLWRRADAAASYGYYNVPYQYREHVLRHADYYYWYAPGAIYQLIRDAA